MATRKYGDKAREKVEAAMHEMKRGELRSGRSGRKVTDAKQAVAIGLSEARREGGKVPDAPPRKQAAPKKRTSRKKAAATKKSATTRRAAPKKGATSKRSPSKRTATSERSTKKRATSNPSTTKKRASTKKRATPKERASA